MVAYSFKPQFIAPIVARTKCQTIRAERRRHAKEGETVQLYTGMRTNHCKLIGRAVCKSVVPIILDFRVNLIVLPYRTITWGPDLDRFAQGDGFKGWQDMSEFWLDTHRTKGFTGVLVRWEDFNAA